MSPDPLAGYRAWCGVWGGTGAAQDGRPVHIRMEIAPDQFGVALRMHFEATSPDGSVLYHGVVTTIGAGPSGALCAATFSTIHGAMVLHQTPDDENVLALEGESLRGNRIQVTILGEGPRALGFAALWRPPGASLDDPRLGRMTATLARLEPMRPPSGPVTTRP
ncbi:MAG: hypothetical protein HS108_12060 [Planctomycetes bacterium]|jgi:hypothetical protein|nr:hypothetical protein [Planctomycetota bacterium]MCL4731165.1 hypothetical protein [Planctomycetota bacterium]